MEQETVPIDSSFVDNGSSDNCGIVTQTLDVTSFTCANVGANTVTMTVTDVAGLTDVSSSTVTVLDTISPQITCPGDQIEVVDASCELSLPDYTGSAIIVENCGGSVIVQTPAAGTLLSGHGTVQVVQLKVTDASGNADSCTFTVTLEDTTDPIAISQDTTVYLDGTGNVVIDSSFVDNGSSDNCGIVTQTLDVTSFTCANVGANTVTMTVTDVAGLTDVSSSTVTVLDTISPQITCPGDQIEVVDASCELSLPDYTGSAIVVENCGGSVIVQTPAAGTLLSGHGTTQIVQLKVTDASGNADSCTFTVTLEDTTDPIAISQDTTVYLGAGGTVTIDSSFVDDGSSDNCGIVTQTLDVSTFTCANVGANTVTMTVTDVAGLTDVSSSTVTVLDTISPQITCPVDQIEVVDAISCELLLPDYTGSAVVVENCGGSVIVQTPAAGTLLSGHGTTQIVQLKVTDASGNADSCTFTVTLEDTTDPIAISQDTTVYLGAGGTVTIDSSFVDDGSSDNCGIVTQTLDVTSFTCADVGANTVTMTVTDVAGLTDVSSSTVTVLDTISPQITCPGDQIEVVDASCELLLPDYTGAAVVVENCGGSVIVQTPAAGTLLSGHGTTQVVQLKVTDASGNADSCTFTVTLEDTTDPIAISQDTTVYLDGTGNVVIDSSFVDNGSSDNCGIVTQTLDVSTFTCANVGANTVTMTVTDVAGLTDVSSSTVTVLDTISPQITCPGDQIEVVDASCELLLPDYTGAAIVVENCGGSVIVQTPAAGTLLSGHGTSRLFS